MNQDFKENLKVWSLGFLSFGPLLSLSSACLLPGESDFAGFLFMGGAIGLRLIMGVVYTGQVWRQEHMMERTTKIFWTLGLLVFFSIFVIPYFWYKFWWEPHRMSQIFEV
jgi:hypothetical protein